MGLGKEEVSRGGGCGGGGEGGVREIWEQEVEGNGGGGRREGDLVRVREKVKFLTGEGQRER